jgi:hypothetical protein
LAAGHAPEFVLMVGKGVRDTWEAWGDVLLARNGKQRTAPDHDVFISHLGYSTTCYYFYNQCDCGYHWPRQCDATDDSGPKSGSDNTPPPNLQGCRNYEDTLIAVHESHISLGCIRLDLIICGTGAGSGLTWTRPKTQPAGVDVSSLVLAPFSDTHPLQIPATTPSSAAAAAVREEDAQGLTAAPKPYGEQILELLYIAPALSNKMVVLGEVGKMVPLSAMRFRSIDDSDQKSTHVVLAGAKGESVEVAFLSATATVAVAAAAEDAAGRGEEAAAAGPAVSTMSCTIGDDGTCSLHLK